jgi:3-methyladenine DNA glycosylase/8-oxoguanine DNA glycosylase
MILKPKPPFDFNLTATHMYLLPPARYSEGTFSRILRLQTGKLVCVSITASNSVDNPELSISVKPKVSEAHEKDIKDKVSFMFSIEDDLTPFYSLAKKDPVLKHAIRDLYGLKVQTTPTLFEGLVVGFCLQWVSFERGVKMINSLINRYGERLNDYHAFPTPEALAKATLKQLKECNLGFRAERIKWIAGEVAKGLDLEGLKSLPDDQLREELMKIKWVGQGTAEALLLWRFKRYSAFPLDVWSSKIFQGFYPELKDKTLDGIKKFAENRWAKFRGLAYYYLICGRKNLARKLGVELGLKWNS